MKKYLIFLLIAVNMLSHGYVLAQTDQSVVDMPDDISIRLDKAIEQLQTGDLNTAFETFKAFLNQYPDHPEANYRMGIVNMRLKKIEEGIEYLKKAAQLEPNNVSYHKTLADAYEFNRLYEEAIQEYDAVTGLVASDSDEAKQARKKIDYLRATQHATRGDVDRAIPLFSRLAEEYPDDALILYSLGLGYLFKGDLDKSKHVFNDLLRLTPDNPNIYLNLATIYEQQGDLVKATDQLRKVVELSPRGRFSEQARVRLGIIEGRLLMREGNLQEALDTLKNVIEIAPTNVVAMFNIAEIYQTTGQLGASEETFEKVIELSPDHLEARLRLAGIYVETNRLNEGVETLQEIVLSGKGSPQEQKATDILKKLQAAKEESMDESQRIQQAQERYQQLINADPDNLEAHFNLGRLYFRQGMMQKARMELEEVVRIDPDNKQGQIALASIYDEMGLFDLAIDRYTTVITMEEDNERADRFGELKELAIAKKLYTDGSLGLAGKKLEEIISKNPDNSTAYFYLGIIYSSEEELSKAVDAYEEVIRLIPGHSGARLNLAINFERLHREEDAISQYRKILEAGPPVNIAETTERRLAAAEKRIRGLSTGLSYSLAADTNSNLSEENQTEDYRSDLSVNLSYQYKMDNGIRMRFSTSPTYSTYHVGNFDFLNTSSSVSATVFPANYTLVGGYTNRTNRGLVTSRRFSDSQVLFGEGATRMKLPQLLAPFSDDHVMSDVSFNASYTDFDSDSSPFFSAFIYVAGLGLNQPYGDRSSVNAGYSYTISENKYDDTLSEDYAYKSHSINIGYERGFSSGISANFRYGYSLINYTNLDSVSQFTEFRKNDRHNFSLGGSYRYHEKIRFFANLSWVINNSNLPVGLILNAEDIIEGQQSSSLGQYNRGTFTLGMNLFL